MPQLPPVRRQPTAPLRAVLACSATLVACSSAHYRADADADVAETLATATQQTLGGREQWVLRPELQRKDAAPPPAEQPLPAEPVAPPPRTVDLPQSLSLAVRQNRTFLAQREALYRAGLSMALTRFQFGPQFAATVNYLWPRSDGGGQSHRAGATLSGSQILPTGGTVSVSTGLDAEWLRDHGGPDDELFGGSAGVTLTQPLLRGAGHAISHEPLTQAERQLAYAIRDFELFRQDFTIEVAQSFFALRSQQQTLANEERNLARAEFDRRQAEALLQVGRKAEAEVFLARRREIEARDQLIDASAAFDRAVDEFKILLGLPTEAPLELAEVEPVYEPVRFEVRSAIAAALHNRLDLITQRQALEDTERSLHIAENDLLPDLNLVANYGRTGSGDRLGDAAPDRWSSSVGVEFVLPLQRLPQRNAYRSSLIALEQARRELQLREDQLELEIRNAMRQLHSIEERITLQEDQIVHERRAARVTRIRFEGGAGSNRDLLEAEQALIDAENALIRLKVDHFVARLRLLRDMGVFFVDDEGMWR
ncbi:MAG: TolC family protein [Planctomycetes bacterium]|nr:TolC family protein [Planctomycetota bacterium]